jgi:phage/plasmid-like protein (TIGR03299 family)
MKQIQIKQLSGKGLSLTGAIEESGIDWNVTTGDSGVLTYDPVLDINTWKRVHSKKGVYRTDTQEPLGDCIVGHGFELVQNTECFSIFEQILENHNAEFTCGGHFHNGASVFLQCKLPSSPIYQNGDTTNRYLLISQGHTGRQALTMRFTHIRPSCTNTLFAALKSSNYFFSLRHTRNVRNSIDDAVRYMKLGLGHLDTVERQFNKFTLLNLSYQEQLNYLKLCYDVKVDSKMKDFNQWKHIEPIFLDSRGFKTDERNTLWHAYNVCAEFEDHHSRVNRPKGNTMSAIEWGKELPDMRQYRSMFVNSTVERKTKAFTLANDVVEQRLDLLTGARKISTGFAALVN